MFGVIVDVGRIWGSNRTFVNYRILRTYVNSCLIIIYILCSMYVFFLNFDIYFNSLYYISVIEESKVEYDCIPYFLSMFAGVRIFPLYFLLIFVNVDTFLLDNILLSTLQLELILNCWVASSFL